MNVTNYFKELNVLYQNGNTYVPMSEHLKLVESNIILSETLKDVCKNGISVEARKLCGLTEDFSESAQRLTP